MLEPGHSKTPTYQSYNCMLDRCYNPNASNYHRYGGLGRKVCDRWRGSYKNFLLDMGTRPSGMTLERKNTKGDYEPGNCIWATPKEQANNRLNNRVLEVRGVRRTLKQWSELTGLSVQLIRYRIDKKGMSVVSAIENPLRNAYRMTYKGRTKTLLEWSKCSGINYRTLRSRYGRGWSPEQCLQCAKVGKKFI